eukprot:587476-Amphidinium_carterae.1
MVLLYAGTHYITIYKTDRQVKIYPEYRNTNPVSHVNGQAWTDEGCATPEFRQLLVAMACMGRGTAPSARQPTHSSGSRASRLSLAGPA